MLVWMYMRNGLCRYWQVSLTGVSVGDKGLTLGTSQAPTNQAVLDVGTTAIVMTSADAGNVSQVCILHNAALRLAG